MSSAGVAAVRACTVSRSLLNSRGRKHTSAASSAQRTFSPLVAFWAAAVYSRVPGSNPGLAVGSARAASGTGEARFCVCVCSEAYRTEGIKYLMSRYRHGD